jgi:hypothetical protein
MLYSVEDGIPNLPDQYAMRFFASCFNDPTSGPHYVHELLEQASIELINTMLQSPAVDRTMNSQTPVSELPASNLSASAAVVAAVQRTSPGGQAYARTSANFEHISVFGHSPLMTTENAQHDLAAEVVLKERIDDAISIGSYSPAHWSANTPCESGSSSVHMVLRVRILEKELSSANRRYTITLRIPLERSEIAFTDWVA